jgi:thioesterase domain-containing protein/acyl carrier protein
VNNINLLCTEASDSARTNSAPASLRLPESREELLEAVRKQNPELQAEDAFVVPTWFVRQKKWFEDPAGSESAVYNYPLLLRIRGPLNEGALQQSLQEIVRRHGPLRSVFRIMDGRLIQIVVAPQAVSLPVTRLDGPPEATELQMQEAARAEAMRPFDLARDSILRCKLMYLQADDHVLQLTTHTLVYDDWSSGVLIRELSETYGAFAAGKMPPRPEMPFQFGDFVRWQQKRLQGPELESHLAFGRQQLDSATGFDHLPLDFVRPARNNYAGAKQTTVLSAAQVDSLMALSRQERVSLFMVLMAGFKCLLHRYSGNEEIGVASCAANRPLEEVEGLIGRFGNSMLLRTSLAGNPTFSELLKRVQGVTLEALSHLEVPFGMLLEATAAGPGRDRSRPFQVMFILQNAPKESWQLPGLSVDWAPLEIETSKFDLIVWLKTEPKLEITLEYSAQLFSPASMSNLLADYLSVLATMATDPKKRLNGVQVSAKPEPVGAKPVPVAAKGTEGVGDRASVEARMIELWRAAFAPRQIDVTKNFFELGGDSLLAVRLFGQINKAFQRTMPLSVLLGAPTIEELVQIICDKTSRSPSSLVSVQTKGKLQPFFFIHGSGGEPTGCWELSRCLGPDQPLYGIRSRSHSEEEILHSVPEIAARYASAIRGVQPSGPYYLGGYCFGGMVAYELARQFTAQGQDIALLAVFDTPAPGTLRLMDRARNKIRHDIWKLRTRGVRTSIRILGIKLARLGRHALVVTRSGLWTLVGKPPVQSAKSLREEILCVSNANISAATAYRPGRYAGQLTLFSTKEAAALYGHDMRERWLHFAAGGVEEIGVDGTHLNQFEEPHIATLAKKLERCIAQAGDPVRVSTPRAAQGASQEVSGMERGTGQGKFALRKVSP